MKTTAVTSTPADMLITLALLAAMELIDKLDMMTTAEFAQGGEHAERERLRELLDALQDLPAPIASLRPEDFSAWIEVAVAPTPADLPAGTPVWYWSREETPGLWRMGTVTDNSGRKDGFDVYDVEVDDFVFWGYTWQVQRRTNDATEPPAPDLALTWP